MKSVNRIALSTIRLNLVACGFDITDDQFNSMTIAQLKRIHRKAWKVHDLSQEIWTEVEEILMDDTEGE